MKISKTRNTIAKVVSRLVVESLDYDIKPLFFSSSSSYFDDAKSDSLYNRTHTPFPPPILAKGARLHNRLC